MNSKAFHPPRYTETHEYIYDKRTGDIVAQETRWLLKRPPALAGRKATTQRLSNLARKSKIPERNLGVLKTKLLRRGYRAIRVDVRKRKLIFERIPDRPMRDRPAPFPPAP